MTNYSRAKETVEKIIKELKDKGIKIKSPLSKTQDYHCEADFSVVIENRLPVVDATVVFDKPPKEDTVEKIEAIMSMYNSYLYGISFEDDNTKLEFRSVI